MRACVASVRESSSACSSSSIAKRGNFATILRSTRQVSGVAERPQPLRAVIQFATRIPLLPHSLRLRQRKTDRSFGARSEGPPLALPRLAVPRRSPSQPRCRAAGTDLGGTCTTSNIHRHLSARDARARGRIRASAPGLLSRSQHVLASATRKRSPTQHSAKRSCANFRCDRRRRTVLALQARHPPSSRELKLVDIAGRRSGGSPWVRSVSDRSESDRARADAERTVSQLVAVHRHESVDSVAHELLGAESAGSRSRQWQRSSRNLPRRWFGSPSGFITLCTGTFAPAISDHGGRGQGLRRETRARPPRSSLAWPAAGKRLPSNGTSRPSLCLRREAHDVIPSIGGQPAQRLRSGAPYRRRPTARATWSANRRTTMRRRRDFVLWPSEDHDLRSVGTFVTGHYPERFRDGWPFCRRTAIRVLR
jgi:hypothetical protein